MARGGGSIMNRLYREIEKVKLVSFDVFDTIIARRCGAPEVVFRKVGEKLALQGVFPITGRTFEQMRVEAEVRARRHKAPTEITLFDIYKEMNALWQLPETEVARLIDCELETEKEEVFLIPGAREMVRDIVRTGKRVAFASDMYLPSEFIRALLTGFEVMRPQDALYVSSQWGVSKAEGGLYRVLLQDQKLLPREVLHIGDSLRADFQQARKLGLSAVHFTRGTLNRYEATLAACERQASEQAGRLAGIARMVRLEMDRFGEHQVAARMGTSIAGPLLTKYAQWVLRVAHQRGLKGLYFLARDGEALLRLCEILAPAVPVQGIELNYLHGSRQVWYPAALLRMDERAAEFFASHVAFACGSWQDCVELLGLCPSSLQETGFARRWTDWSANPSGKRALFLDLAQNPELGARVKSWLEERAALTRRYVSQAGLVGSEPIGLVDCGWSGTWTDILCDLVEAAGGRRPEVYFLGRRKATNPSRAFTSAFLYDHQAGLGLADIPDYLHVLVEFFLTASHGRTVGFKEDGGKLAPLMAATDLQGFRPQEWEIFREALLRFAQTYAVSHDTRNDSADLRKALVEPLTLLWERPSLGEADLLGRHTIGLSPARSSDHLLARRYNLHDAVRLTFRLRLPGYAPCWWHEGALAQTPLPFRLWMAALWQARNFARWLRDANGSQLRPGSLARLCRSQARKFSHVFRVPADTVVWQLKQNQTQPVPHLARSAPAGPRVSVSP
jgi:FMN phosphatase YigB (HAD superfamily)